MPSYQKEVGRTSCVWRLGPVINVRPITGPRKASVAKMSSRHSERNFVIFLSLIFGALMKDQFQRCKRYTSFGYGYRDFFEFREGNFSPNVMFYLEFYVKTSSDAHILLKADGAEDLGYEIVIGGGSNTFSQIRLADQTEKKTMITQKTENYLAPEEYRMFWISLDKLGIVSVGREEDEVFINWRFDNPIKVKSFSFGSWTNVKADWRFGCEKQNESEIIHEEKQLSPLRQLKRDLFTLYDPNALPVEKNATLEVKAYFHISNVQLDEKRGELTLYGSGNLDWRDEKMKWKPSNYDGIKTVYVPPFQIWTPSIRVLKWMLTFSALAFDRAPLFDLTVAGVMVNSDGSVSWRAPFKSVSFCTLDLKYWPFDIHNCSVLLGFWMEPSNLVLTIMDDSETLTKDRTDSGWEVVQASPYNTNHPEEDENYGILYVELRRQNALQVLILTVPYVASLVMSLSSFWVPVTTLKLHLRCGSLAIMLLSLFLAGNSVPAMTQTVPKLVVLYSWSTVVTCIPIVLFVVLINIQIYIPIPETLSKVLSNRVLSEVFCLPELNTALTEYCNLNDEVNKANRDHLNALKLVTIFERIFFLLYLSALIVFIALI